MYLDFNSNCESWDTDGGFIDWSVPFFGDESGDFTLDFDLFSEDARTETVLQTSDKVEEAAKAINISSISSLPHANVIEADEKVEFPSYEKINDLLKGCGWMSVRGVGNVIGIDSKLDSQLHEYLAKGPFQTYSFIGGKDKDTYRLYSYKSESPKCSIWPRQFLSELKIQEAIHGFNWLAARDIAILLDATHCNKSTFRSCLVGFAEEKAIEREKIRNGVYYRYGDAFDGKPHFLPSLDEIRIKLYYKGIVNIDQISRILNVKSAALNIFLTKCWAKKLLFSFSDGNQLHFVCTKSLENGVFEENNSEKQSQKRLRAEEESGSNKKSRSLADAHANTGHPNVNRADTSKNAVDVFRLNLEETKHYLQERQALLPSTKSTTPFRSATFPPLPDRPQQQMKTQLPSRIQIQAAMYGKGWMTVEEIKKVLKISPELNLEKHLSVLHKKNELVCKESSSQRWFGFGGGLINQLIMPIPSLIKIKKAIEGRGWVSTGQIARHFCVVERTLCTHLQRWRAGGQIASQFKDGSWHYQFGEEKKTEEFNSASFVNY